MDQRLRLTKTRRAEKVPATLPLFIF